MREKLIDIVEWYADFLDWERKEDIVDRIIELLATDNNVGHKWIPVSERLPEVGQLCLCYRKRKGRTGYQMGTFLGAVFSADCAAFKSISHYGCVSATHWMPLPEPPKGE